MADIKALFEQAQVDIKKLTSRPSNDDMLALYATFKQATTGDASGKRPGMMDMVGRAKFDAWAKQSGKTAEDAMKAYLDKVKALLG